MMIMERILVQHIFFTGMEPIGLSRSILQQVMRKREMILVILYQLAVIKSLRELLEIMLMERGLARHIFFTGMELTG